MLALLEFFWDANAPIAPPVIIIPDATPGRGSGKSKAAKDREYYRTFDDEYWLERDSRMKEDAPKNVHFINPADAQRAARSPRQVTEVEMQIAALRQQLVQAPSIEALKAIAGQIASLKSGSKSS